MSSLREKPIHVATKWLILPMVFGLLVWLFSMWMKYLEFND
jgi:hypothetical protein